MDRPEGRDISKLPVWASGYIRNLEDRLTRAQEKISAGPEESTVFADPHRYRIPLGIDPTVRFEGVLRPPSVVLPFIDVSWNHSYTSPHNREKLTVLIRGRDGLEVVPQASNTILVRLQES